MTVNGVVNFTLPKKMECSVALDKLSMEQLINDWKIPRKQLIQTYGLKNLPNDDSDSSDGETSTTTHPLEDEWPMPFTESSKKSKRKKVSNKKSKNPLLRCEASDDSDNCQLEIPTPSLPDQDYEWEDMISYMPSKKSKKKKVDNNKNSKNSLPKRKTNGQFIPSKRQKVYSNQSVVRSKDNVSPVPTNGHKVIKPTIINGTPHLKAIHLNGNHINGISHDESFSPNHNRRTRPVRAATSRKPAPDHNRIVDFLGERFRHSDIFDDHCQCENNCELDELSMAFDFIMKLRADQLPKDLKIAVMGRPADLLSSESDRSDPNLDELIPGGVDTIYGAAIDDNYLNDCVNEFVSKTTVPNMAANIDTNITNNMQ